MMRTPYVLDTAGPQAEPVATLGWALIVGGVAVLVVVLAILAIALYGGRWRERLANDRTIIVGGVVFPVVVLTALLVWGLGLTADLVRAHDDDPLTIRVQGEQWWWRVHYDAPLAFATANEIVIPVGRAAWLELTTRDVIHSFWVPQLAGKLDMIPGKINRLRLVADRPGVFYGACAEYCGGPHALMQFRVIALEPAEFDRWLVAQARPARPSSDPETARGAALFLEIGCGSCHRIAGTPADGLLGPDLTHVGSRRHIGAGLLPTNRGTLAGWIANPQRLKPNVNMPAYPALSGPELRALAAYLDSLE